MVLVVGVVLIILRLTNTMLHSFGSHILLKQYHNGKDTTDQLLAINLALTQAAQVGSIYPIGRSKFNVPYGKFQTV